MIGLVQLIVNLKQDTWDFYMILKGNPHMSLEEKFKKPKIKQIIRIKEFEENITSAKETKCAVLCQNQKPDMVVMEPKHRMDAFGKMS